MAWPGLSSTSSAAARSASSPSAGCSAATSQLEHVSPLRMGWAAVIRWAAFGRLAYPGRPGTCCRSRAGTRPAAGSGVATDAWRGHGPPNGEYGPFSDRFRSSRPRCLLDLAQAARPEQKGGWRGPHCYRSARWLRREAASPWDERGRAAGCPGHGHGARARAMAVAPSAPPVPALPRLGAGRHAAFRARAAQQDRRREQRSRMACCSSAVLSMQSRGLPVTHRGSDFAAWRSRYGARPPPRPELDSAPAASSALEGGIRITAPCRWLRSFCQGR